MAENKKQNYLHGAAILAFGVVIMKILGAIYKIPLGNILGDTGYGYFFAAYTIYNVLLTVSTAGLPVALSRLISEANTLGRPNQARRTFRVAFGTLFVLGAVFTLLMFVLPTDMAIILTSKPEASQSVLALAPAVLLVCLTSAYRGYIQGSSNMTPTTISQVLEVLVKVIVGLALAWVFTGLGKSLPICAAGATFGVTAGSLAALVYIFLHYNKHYRLDPSVQHSADKPDSVGKTLARFLKIGIPITLGASVMSVISLIDTKLVNKQLLEGAALAKPVADTLWGSYSLMQTLYNLPAAFITPLTISVVPAIASAVARKQYDEAGETAESCMRISAVMALPMGVGLSALSYPIVNVLYEDTDPIGPTLLAILGAASFFVCMALIMNAVLQANGNERYPVYSMLVGGAVKICVNWVLVGNPDINIVGAPIGTLSCYLVMCVMNAVFIKKSLVRKPSFLKVLVRPLVSSIIMGGAAWGVYGLLSKMLSHGAELSRLMMALAMVIAIGVAVIVYLLLIILTRAVTGDDMRLIPKGDKLAKLLRIK